MLEEYKSATGKDLIPKSGPVEMEKIYLERAREFYKRMIIKTEKELSKGPDATSLLFN